MRIPYALMLLSLTVLASPAVAEPVARTETTVVQDNDGNYRKTVRQDVVTPQPSAVTTQTTTYGDTTVSRTMKVERPPLASQRTVVSERTQAEPPALYKPAPVTKKTEVTESNSLGDSSRTVTQQTVNGDGYMVREEYREQRN